MDSSPVASIPQLWRPCRLQTYIRPPPTSFLRMLGLDELVARRLPIAVSCSWHVDLSGFCQRRFDRFVIVQGASQS